MNTVNRILEQIAKSGLLTAGGHPLQIRPFSTPSIMGLPNYMFWCVVVW